MICVSVGIPVMSNSVSALPEHSSTAMLPYSVRSWLGSSPYMVVAVVASCPVVVFPSPQSRVYSPFSVPITSSANFEPALPAKCIFRLFFIVFVSSAAAGMAKSIHCRVITRAEMSFMCLISFWFLLVNLYG